jgi:hypothetical protein
MFFNQFISTTNKNKKNLYIKTFFALFVFLITINFAPNAHADNKDLRFILTGHMYPILSDEIRLNNFLKKINSHNPDILFILGDSNLHKIDHLKKIKSKIKAKIFFSPGNQELLPENADNYLSNIGYLNKTVIKNDIRFIILNSSEKKSNIINYLNENLKNDNKTNLILTHHRIWDDSIIDKQSYSHDKSFYFEDIYPIINGKVKAIFSGNSKRQYFRDLKDHSGYGKQNVNLIYWMDKIGSIDLYSIGMGDGSPKATFTIVDVVDDKLIVNGDFSSTDEYDILPKNLIVYNEEKIDKNNIRRIREIIKDRYLLINKKKLHVTLTVLFFLILIFIFYKKLKKS